MQDKRYINRNAFPVWLPTPRGGQMLFRPGEFTTEQWFSRFVGRDQLTAELVNQPGVPILVKPQTTPAAPQPIVHPAIAPAVAAKKVAPTFTSHEETPHYVMRNGVYQCKLCEIFRTGSAELMRAHLGEYHGLDDAAVQGPVLAEKKEEEVVRGTMPPVASQQPAPVTKPAETASAPLPAQPSMQATIAETATEPPPEVHACTVLGCGKNFTSRKGLALHMIRVHKNAPTES